MWGDPTDRQAPFWEAAVAVLAGAGFLLWPALLNTYPILFSDTHAFLVQAGEPRMVWDKPFVYGPFLRLLHGRATLWLPAVAQTLILSHLLWLLREAFATPTLLRHLVTCALLAVLTSAPWFATLLMPDIFAPITVICLFLLGFGDRLERSSLLWVGLLGTIAIASHLSHLVIAAACLLVVALLRTVRLPRASWPLAAALALLIATNLIGYKRFAVSPYGSVFLLARLVADGPAAETLAAECPHPGWRLCSWVGQLPADSDAFLWNGDGPVWSTQGGPPALAREAAEIVTATVQSRPMDVVTAAWANTLRQLGMFQLGDTLHPTWLETSVTGSLEAYFPPVELRRFRASRQAADTLAAVASPFEAAHLAALGIGGGICALLVVSLALAGRTLPAALATITLVGLLANAAATGALSKPHDRYQARIVWLLVAAPLISGLRNNRREV